MSDAAEILEDLMPPAGRSRWGPFVLALSHPERVTRLLVLRAFCQIYLPRGAPIYRLLKLAESGEWDEIEDARLEFDRLPALTSRRILDSYARHWKYAAKREPKPAPASEEWR